MKFRISQWLDMSDDEAEEYSIKYEIQVHQDKQWKHCHDDGKPLIYDTPEEAGTKMTELKEKLAASSMLCRLDNEDEI